MPRVGALALALWGCSEFRLNPQEQDGVPDVVALVSETFVQDPLPKVDLLFVIDDAPSMASEQDELGDDLALLASGLDSVGVAWHVGAVAANMQGAEAGWLRGEPWLVTTNTREREMALHDLAEIGTSSGSDRAGFAAALRALELAAPGGPNAAFRRKDAVLHLVFVSDAGDQSDAYLDDPVADFERALAEQGIPDAPARVSAVIEPAPDGCGSGAQPAPRYEQVVADSQGVQLSICAADFATLLVDLGQASISYSTRFPLREQPDEGSMQVSLDVPFEGAWTVDVEEVVLVFDEPPPAGAVISVEYTVSTAADEVEQ